MFTGGIAPKPKKNLKLILIVSGIIVVIIAVICAAALYSLQPADEKQAVNTPTNVALKQYGDYLAAWDVTSEESTLQLKTYFDSFYSLASLDDAYKSIMEQLSDYNNAITIAGKIVQINRLNDEQLLDLYLSTGYESTLNYIEQIYINMDVPEEALDYLWESEAYYRTLLLAYKTYDEYGCIVNGVVDDDCAINAEMDDNKLSSDIAETYAEKQNADLFERKVYAIVQNSYNEIAEEMGLDA